MIENIYDIRKRKQLQFILSTECSPFVLEKYKNLRFRVAIVANLYYTEKVASYCQYLNSIPKNFDLYIFSSKDETLLEAKRYLCHKSVIYIKKENRGRDLSAFLVAFRPHINKYDLICFVHDKKEHNQWKKADTDKWNENLWGNMIASTNYIYNVLYLFERNHKLGILFPPEPIGEYIMEWFHNSWEENIEYCMRLAKKMGLKTDIKEEKPPISFGSVFWTRKDALLKLFNMNWKYKDFPDEPMPLDATISHAIERILGYIAQDSGYEVGTVMTEKYASWQMLFLQDYVRMMFSELSVRMGVDNLNQLRLLYVQKKRILNYVKSYNTFFIYGAGKCGLAVLKLLRENQVEPAGFIVSDKTKSSTIIDGLEVYQLDELSIKEYGIVLTVYYPLQEEIIEELEKKEITDYFLVFDKEYCGFYN